MSLIQTRLPTLVLNGSSAEHFQASPYLTVRAGTRLPQPGAVLGRLDAAPQPVQDMGAWSMSRCPWCLYSR
jgi:hypothetical protein